MSSHKQKNSASSNGTGSQSKSFYTLHIAPLLDADKSVLFSVSGPFSSVGLTSSMQELRERLSGFQAKFQFNLCAVFIELYQNIDRYGLPLPDTDEKQSERAFGCIQIITDDAGGYQLRAINLVCQADTFQLGEKLSALQALDKKGLAARYRAQLASLAPISGKSHRRTGLGLIDMARRVDGQFSFMLNRADDDHCLLILEAHFQENSSTPLATRTEKMNPFTLKASSRSPKVTLSPAENKLLISGESYPENVTAFYAQLEAALKDYLAKNPERLEVDIALRYFNSGSAHALLTLLRMLDSYAQKGCEISLLWKVVVDDDIGREFAQDIAEQAPNLFLNISEMSE